MGAAELEGQLAVVTGAASGIGRATAVLLAARGARVVVGDLDREGGRRACDEIEARGGAALFAPLDVTDDASIAAFASEGCPGPAGVLVNAAGWDRAEPFLDNSLEFIERIVRLNLLGAIKVTKALLPGMIGAGGGRIVNVASDAGRVGSSGETVYAGAKGGLIAFSKSLARELARHGIAVNCVCPGPTDTPLFRSMPERLQEGLVRAIPLRRLAQPEEIAHAIAFFAGPGAGYVTGQVLSVSGGLTMAG
jgi:2-hydroxycyclohexanecarboxyl-CoA dehydrogenase